MPVRKTPLPSKEFLDACFIYNRATGDLFWKSRPEHHFKNSEVARLRNAKYTGMLAGRINDTSGYRKIEIDCKPYAAHRIIWRMITGEEPEDEIDHKNGVRHDNRWENLRSCTRAQNQHNKNGIENNTGFKNVKLHKGRYIARICVENTRVHLGSFDSAEEAYRVFCETATAIRGEYANLV